MCITLQCHELNCFVTQPIYTLVTRSQFKLKFFRLSNALVKICEVPHVNFKTTSQLLFNFCIILHCHCHCQLHCKFEAHTFSLLDKRILSNFQFWHFRVLWWKLAKFFMSFLKQQVSFSSNFASRFNVMKDNFSLLF